MNPKPFAVGDKVVILGGFDGSPQGLDVVVAVSEKRGEVKLKKSKNKYTSYGNILPRQDYSTNGIAHAKPEHYELIERRNITHRMEKIETERLSLDELRQINAIIKPHWDKQKAEEKP